MSRSLAQPQCLENDAGLVALRRNFRGVGQSSGTHDEGYGELDDVRAGLDYLTKNYAHQEITLCGFSFGARVGLEVGLADDRVVRLSRRRAKNYFVVHGAAAQRMRMQHQIVGLVVTEFCY